LIAASECVIPLQTSYAIKAVWMGVYASKCMSVKTEADFSALTFSAS
jgi:hypothetical protein